MGTAVNDDPEVPGVGVLVVDHRRAFSEALATRLGQEADVVVVGVVETLEAAERALDELQPTVGTVAIGPEGGGNGLLLVARARRIHPGVRWVVIAGDGEPFGLADAFVAGASGYVTMDSPVSALLAALHGAVEGLSITPHELLRRVLMELDAGRRLRSVGVARPVPAGDAHR